DRDRQRCGPPIGDARNDQGRDRHPCDGHDFQQSIRVLPVKEAGRLEERHALEKARRRQEAALAEQRRKLLERDGEREQVDDAYLERVELQPIDPQMNGPQLFYGLRYHVHVVKPGEVETFHDQVGYWLWEPATKTVIHTLAIPRAQVALAIGFAEPDAREFE